MHFGLVGIALLFKLKYRKVSFVLILLFLFIPEIIYLGLLIYQEICLSQFPPILSPSPEGWSHSLVTSGILYSITAAVIFITKKEKANLILGTLPVLNILLNTYSIYYAVYYFYPLPNIHLYIVIPNFLTIKLILPFEEINTVLIKANIEFSNYMRSSVESIIGRSPSYGLILWPYEAIYWIVDLLTLFFCIFIALWRMVKTEFEEKLVIKIDEDFIIPSDYSLIHNYPRVEEISLNESKMYSQEEWENIAKAIRDEINGYRFEKGLKLDFEYKYSDFRGYVLKIEKPRLSSYEKQIKKIYMQLNFKENFEDQKINVNKLNIPLIRKGSLFLIQVKKLNKTLKRELLYISQEGSPVFLNRGKNEFLEFDYKKFNLIIKYENIGLSNLINYNYDSKNEISKHRINFQILNIVKLFIMLFGCFRERILYSNQEIDKWKVYDYKNPDREYKIEFLPINLIEIYKLQESFGIILWTWADYYSKWAIFLYQFQLFHDGFRPDVFKLYRIPVYIGTSSSED